MAYRLSWGSRPHFVFLSLEYPNNCLRVSNFKCFHTLKKHLSKISVKIQFHTIWSIFLIISFNHIVNAIHFGNSHTISGLSIIRIFPSIYIYLYKYEIGKTDIIYDHLNSTRFTDNKTKNNTALP